MPLVSWMQPRDHRDAARTLGLLISVAVGVTILTLPVSGTGVRDSNTVLLVLAVAAFVVAVLLAMCARYLTETSRVAWTAAPLLAVLANTLIGLGTGDASIGAQIFFVFCAIYGGALLTVPGAWVMAGAAVVGEAGLVFAQLSFDAALNSFVYLTATLVTTSYLLSRNAARLAVLLAELERRASTDSLTGLVNRRTFDRAIGRALVRSDDPLGTALILVDIDWFKSINDEFGHPGGDEVLVQLSDLIAALARRGDVVCRLGGDEMAVLMPQCTLDTGHERAADMVDAVRAHPFRTGPATGVSVSISAGVAHFPTHARSSLELYAVADAALYEAKRAGRDRVVRHAS